MGSTFVDDPVGADEAGMPIAVQLISKNGNEDVLFKLGEIVEKEFKSYNRVMPI